MKALRIETARHASLIILVLCLVVLSLRPGISEASVTVAWDQTTTNADGSACVDLAGYKIYYDTDGSGAPYSGTGLTAGASPIIVPVTSLSDPANPQFNLSGLTAGATYHVAVTAYDGSNNESGYSTEITFSEGGSNQAPTADAGADQIVTQNQLNSGGVQVTLDGSGSSDPDGDVLTYSWTQIDGPAVNLLGSTSAAPFFSVTPALLGQILAFRLTVNDGQLDSNPDLVKITVEDAPAVANSPPSATASASPTSGVAPLNVQFNGQGTDSDGTIVSYAWSFGDGQSGNGASPTHTYSAAGTYTATLTVIDDQGATASASVLINVSNPPPANSPPSATAGASPTSGVAPLNVQFNGQGTDSDGTVVSYAWSFGDGQSGNGASTTHTYSAAGAYTARLTVTDDQGATASASVSIEVSNPPVTGQQLGTGTQNVLPTVTIQTDKESGVVPLTVNFAASASDSDGTISDYAWDFGDQSSSHLQSLAHTFTAVGVYTVSLCVTDDAGGQATVGTTITVSDPKVDSDNDGLTNAEEVAFGLNSESADSDGDGISDLVEWGVGDAPIDTDADGTIDALDLDSDNDGKPDAVEGTGDFDDDGALNYIDMNDADGPNGDQDGDGVININETSYGLNPNLEDSDGDGISDSAEWGSEIAPADTDEDGIIDALDTDSDNDGISDYQESDSDIDGNGVPDRKDATVATLDVMKGRIALMVKEPGARLAETAYISDPSSYLTKHPPADFSYGGFQYKIENVPVGGSVAVAIYSEQKFTPNTEYWKYDGMEYSKLATLDKPGHVLSFQLTDGGTGDSDHTVNGSIQDPGFISEPILSSPTTSDTIMGDGGLGCSISPNSENLPDVLWFLFPFLLIFLLTVKNVRGRAQ